MPRGVYNRAPKGEQTQSANIDLMRDAIRAVWNPLNLGQRKEILNRIGWKTSRVAHFDIDQMTDGPVAGLYRDRVKVNKAVSDIKEEYQETPDISTFTKKLSVRDFNLTRLDMYIKRYLELREFNKLTKK